MFLPEQQYHRVSLTLDDIKKSLENQTPIVGLLQGFDRENNNFKVSFGAGLSGIIPKEYFSVYPNDFKTSGNVACYVSEITEDGVIILNRYTLIIDTIQEIREKRYDILKSTVLFLPKTGAVCDIGNGVRGFIPLKNLSRCHIFEASDVLNPGKNITLKIDSYSPDKTSFECNYKDVFKTSFITYRKGQIISGVVRTPVYDDNKRVTGYFVEVSPNTKGIVDGAALKYGQRLNFKVKSISSTGLKLEIA